MVLRAAGGLGLLEWATLNVRCPPPKAVVIVFTGQQRAPQTAKSKFLYPSKKEDYFTGVLVQDDARKSCCFGWGLARVWASLDPQPARSGARIDPFHAPKNGYEFLVSPLATLAFRLCVVGDTGLMNIGALPRRCCPFSLTESGPLKSRTKHNN